MPKTETDIEKRNKYGMLCGIVGIFLNLILFAGKLFAGMFSGAISITADAFNNLSDAGSSIITIAGFKMAAQRADEEHPYLNLKKRCQSISGVMSSNLIAIFINFPYTS